MSRTFSNFIEVERMLRTQIYEHERSKVESPTISVVVT